MHTEDPKPPSPRRRWRWLPAVWLLATLLSHLPDLRAPAAATATHPRVQVPRMTDRGPSDGTMQVAYRHWPAAAGRRPRPVVLVHGSPGDADNFRELGPRLAEAGYETYAVDLPGFGDSDAWVPSYSIRAHAHALRAFCDALRIERPHLVGWSMGGGVILHVADDRPGEVASLTLMGAIGAQRNEGSGDYYFEHAKYALGYAVFVVGGELVPLPWHHTRSFRHAWIRNFWDTDQRPLADLMRNLDLPVLILHGRRDPLVADWAAERHHEMMPTSRLVMLDASHFLPFTPVETTRDVLVAFFNDAEAGRVRTDYDNRAPRPVPFWGAGLIDDAAGWLRDQSWLGQALLVGLLTRGRWWLGLALAGWLVGGLYVDPLVAGVGVAGGRLAGPRRLTASGWRWLTTPLTSAGLVVLSSVLAGFVMIPAMLAAGGPGWLLGIGVTGALFGGLSFRFSGGRGDEASL